MDLSIESTIRWFQSLCLSSMLPIRNPSLLFQHWWNHVSRTINRSMDSLSLFWKQRRNGQGYVPAEHLLLCANERIEQNWLTYQTVISKWLGTSDQWLPRLEVTFHSGYNLIHFTPIQSLSSLSNFSYSIANHHQINPLFQDNSERIKEIVQTMEKQWKIFSIIHLVYNHVATDCILLREHPGASYNLVNSPHLRPAVLFDAILIHFTRDASEGKLSAKGILAKINENHLEVISSESTDVSFSSESLAHSWLSPERRNPSLSTRGVLSMWWNYPSSRISSSGSAAERMSSGEFEEEHRGSLNGAWNISTDTKPSESPPRSRALLLLPTHTCFVQRSMGGSSLWTAWSAFTPIESIATNEIQWAHPACGGEVSSILSSSFLRLRRIEVDYSKLSFSEQPLVGNNFCYPDG